MITDASAMAARSAAVGSMATIRGVNAAIAGVIHLGAMSRPQGDERQDSAAAFWPRCRRATRARAAGGAIPGSSRSLGQTVCQSWVGTDPVDTQLAASSAENPA